MSGQGHNSGVDSGHLRAFVERIEKMHEERKAINADIAEIYAEAKGTGFDKKALAHVVKTRGQDKEKRAEFEAIVGVYMSALGIP